MVVRHEKFSALVHAPEPSILILPNNCIATSSLVQTPTQLTSEGKPSPMSAAGCVV